ncbi:MAG: hypothetical protein IMW99_01855 [Firmicutes bacterium]|nr:hypothetical protein [Bacillota bacterium]
MRRIVVAAVQLDLGRTAAQRDFPQVLHRRLASLAARGIQLALLPAGTGLMWWPSAAGNSTRPGTCPVLRQAEGPAAALGLQKNGAAGQAVPPRFEPRRAAKRREPVSAPLVHTLPTAADGEKALRDYLAFLTRSAQELGMFLAGGSTLVPVYPESEKGGTTSANSRLSWLHRAFVAGPDGFLASQDQIHVEPLQRVAGWAPGQQLAPIESPLGRLGLLVGRDAWYPEAGRLLVLQGAEILLAPVYLPWSASAWQPTAGLWQLVQQNQVFALEAYPVGTLWGQTWQGYSAVHAPVEMTPDDEGYLAQAHAPDQDEDVVAVLDPEELQKVLRQYSIFRQFNLALYARGLPQVYGSRAAGGTRAPGDNEVQTAGAGTAPSQQRSTFPASSPPQGAESPAELLPVQEEEDPPLGPDSGWRRWQRFLSQPLLSAVLWERAWPLWTKGTLQFWHWRSRAAGWRPSSAAAPVAHSGPAPQPQGLKRPPGAKRERRTGWHKRVRPQTVRAAAIQMEIWLASSAREYATRIYRLAREARQAGAEIIAFPEDSGTPLLGLLPGIAKLLSESASLDEALSKVSGGRPITAADVFRAAAPAARPVYEDTFSSLSRLLKAYVVSGSIMLPLADGRLVNVAYVFGPDGRLLGRQYKAHLIPLEERLGLSPLPGLHVFTTPWGKLACPICMDATYFETFRIAVARGAEVVVIPSANPEPYLPGRARRGIWPRVQESQVFGIGPSLVGQFAEFTFTGRSAILAPLDMTPNRDGFLARAHTSDKPEVVVADLDLERLRDYRENHPLELRADFYAGRLLPLYRPRHPADPGA